MDTELMPLVLLILMQMVMGIAATAAISRVAGNAYLFSSRAVEPDFRDCLAGRLNRARSNGFEAITYFAPIALILVVSETSTASTVAAAWVFVGARAAYWVCYAADLTPWRTIIWFVGFFALFRVCFAS